MNEEKLRNSTTTSGAPPEPGFEQAAAPAPIDQHTGQHKAYWVLSADERAKGFVRPVRHSYKHVGIPGPTYPLRDLTDEEKQRHASGPLPSYVKFEVYLEHDSPVSGRFWRQSELDKVGKGCGVVTRMGPAIAETYARDPQYYGSTFCAGCSVHLPVGEHGEFVWDDAGGERVGT